MLIRHSLLIIAFLPMFSCALEHASQRASADSLFETFRVFSTQLQREMSDDYFLSCSDRSHTGIGAFFRVVDQYVDEMGRINREGRSLKLVQIEMLNFAHAIDSVSSVVYGDEYGRNMVGNSISNRYINEVSFTPMDTVLLLNEALRVLALARTSCPQFKPACRSDGYSPYIEIQTIANADSIRVRVGLRIQNICVDPNSFAVLFGDTVMFDFFGTADFYHHADRIHGLDSLMINSCVGRFVTGEISCFSRGVAVGW